MAASQEDIARLLANARDEWNRAEEVVKSAEQICGEAVVPSIKELRYAGRRLIDSLQVEAGRDLDLVEGYLKDAIFNCHCARHDAIDVATAVVATNLNVVVKKIGYDHVLKAFPNFAELREDLSAIRAKIRVSRANRTDRDAIYQSIHDTDLPRLAGRYDSFQSAEDIMRSLARKERWGDVVKTAITIASVLVAVSSCALTNLKPPPPPTYVYLPQGAPAPPPGARIIKAVPAAR